jgi:hypothetical protein
LARYLSWFHPLKFVIRTSFDRYHAKIISLSDIQKILTLNEDIDIASEQNKQIVPFAYAYRILFEEADFIAVMDCPCKLTLNAPAWTINSCISVGRKTSTFWLDHCGEKFLRRRRWGLSGNSGKTVISRRHSSKWPREAARESSATATRTRASAFRPHALPAALIRLCP